MIHNSPTHFNSTLIQMLLMLIRLKIQNMRHNSKTLSFFFAETHNFEILREKLSFINYFEGTESWVLQIQGVKTIGPDTYPKI